MELIKSEYFEALGTPKPGVPFGAIDNYRFKMVIKRLASGSVLDVGAYFGDFLNFASEAGHEIAGTEVNESRVALANKLLGVNVIKQDFRNGELSTFGDNEHDNVVCTEVIEHVPDHQYAISELARVARKRVIITVPYMESIKEVCCLHCCKYTPLSGHLHSYENDSFEALLPHGWKIAEKRLFGRTIVKRLANWLSIPKSWHGLVALLDRLAPGRHAWIMVVLEPQ